MAQSLKHTPCRTGCLQRTQSTPVLNIRNVISHQRFVRETMCRANPETKESETASSTTSTSGSESTSGGPFNKSELMAKIKSYGVAGTLSYVITELIFWAIALPGAYFGYHQSTGDWLSLETDRAQLIALAAAFVTGVRFAVPLRMGAALAMIPTVKQVLEGSKKQ